MPPRRRPVKIRNNSTRENFDGIAIVLVPELSPGFRSLLTTNRPSRELFRKIYFPPYMCLKLFPAIPYPRATCQNDRYSALTLLRRRPIGSPTSRGAFHRTVEQQQGHCAQLSNGQSLCGGPEAGCDFGVRSAKKFHFDCARRLRTGRHRH